MIVVFVIFAVLLRAFLLLICISLSLFISGLPQFRDFFIFTTTVVFHCLVKVSLDLICNFEIFVISAIIEVFIIFAASRGPSLTSFAFSCHFLSWALKNFEILVNFAIFVAFIIFAASSRALLDLICIFSSLFVKALQTFKILVNFTIFVIFLIFAVSSRALLVLICIFLSLFVMDCAKFQFQIFSDIV